MTVNSEKHSLDELRAQPLTKARLSKGNVRCHVILEKYPLRDLRTSLKHPCRVVYDACGMGCWVTRGRDHSPRAVRKALGPVSGVKYHLTSKALTDGRILDHWACM